MKRWILCFALCAPAVWGQERGSRILWVKYDAEARAPILSNGALLTNSITPGQFVGYDRRGLLRTLRQWRPPQDIEKTYNPTGETRVTFSHERHFAALGVKDCKSCHAEEKGLGTGKALASLATDPGAEPHGDKSAGRFCAQCHRSDLKTSQIPGANPPLDVAMFTALGKKGDATCASCHAPADHGADFTGRHGDRAEGGGRRCVSCHRGATGMSQAEFDLAKAYQQAQLALIRNPDDKEAFRRTLPSNYCAYCHAFDRRLQRGEAGGGGPGGD